MDAVGVEAHVVSIVRAVELTQEQVRVLGCLVEKERTTPDDYPLTANSVMRAANQTTSRDPIVSYDLSSVERELAGLKELGLVRFVHSPSNRATKHRHTLDQVLGLDERETALLGLLFLRGDQTPGELLSRSERLARFGSIDEVVATLERLAAREEPLVAQRDRVPGQQQRRWGHRWQAPPDPAALAAAGGVAPGSTSTSTAARIAALEAEVADLRAGLVELRVALGLDPEAASPGQAVPPLE